jgi:hypothetical protein
MKYNAASLRNLTEWRKKLFVKTRSGSGGSHDTTTSEQPEKGEKGEKGEKEIKNEIPNQEHIIAKKYDENIYNINVINKVINNLSVHLEKIQSVEQKEKMVHKKKGDIVYNTRDGRVLQAFHSCERGKIIWDDNVYDDLKTWLAAANVVTSCCCN